MKKVAFILPGFFHSTKESGYQTIGKYFSRCGYRVIYLEIIWKYKTVSDYLKQFHNIYNIEKGETNVVLGFSYGALVAFLAAVEVKPDYLYLCSPAPYFREDLPFIPDWDKKDIGRKRFSEIEKHSFDNTSTKITCPVSIFFGSEEEDFVKRRVRLAQEKLKNSTLIKVKGVGHDIADQRYLEAVMKEISRFS